MSTKTDGGPVHPRIKTLGPGGREGRLEEGYGSIVSEGGINLRAYFAGQAMIMGSMSGYTYQEYAKHCVQLADALIAELNKP